MMEPLTVGVFDDHVIFAEGVAAILREDGLIGRVTDDHRELADIDVAVASLREIRERGFEVPVVACLGASDRQSAVPAHASMFAVLPRESVTPDQLRSAVHAAAAGLRIQSQSTSDDVLDDRSRRVLRMLAEGAATREISIELGYSERTIKEAIRQVQRTLGARSRAQAVAVALRNALI